MHNIIRFLESEQSKQQIITLISDNMSYYQAIDTEYKTDEFSGILYNYFVQECVRDNQYISLSRGEFDRIHTLYKDLIRALKELDDATHSRADIRVIVENHRRNLIGIIRGRIGDHEEQIIVPCAEYTADLQVSVLRIDPSALLEPIMDIGCGKDAKLVRLLAGMGKETYGMDQYYSAAEHIICENWLDFRFAPGAWGTIISHMSFTNHYRRAMAFDTQERERYERAFHDILASLMPGGAFIYSPVIPGIEDTLDPHVFTLARFTNIEDDRMMDTVHITRTGS